MKKRLMSIGLACLLAVSLAVPAAAAYTDISSDAWYASDVNDIQQYGLIAGVGGNRFDPQGRLSLAQAITLAARTHAMLNDKTIEESGTAWYQAYVDYAIRNGIYKTGEYGTNYNVGCSRMAMAVLFQRVFPKTTEKTRNTVNSLPDVQNSGSGAAVFYLYRQGVLTGVDAYGTFRPDSGITRAETAAILNRVIQPGKRKTFSLVPKLSSVLPEARFAFASGAGAWSTELTLHPDGSFEGMYSDSDFGSGQGYDWICYFSTFTGQFDRITKVDKYTYSMRLASLRTKETKKEWIENRVRYIAAQPNGLEGDGLFYLYLPGKPTANLNEDFKIWHIAWGKLPRALTGYAIHNLSENYGFFQQ